MPKAPHATRAVPEWQMNQENVRTCDLLAMGLLADNHITFVETFQNLDFFGIDDADTYILAALFGSFFDNHKAPAFKSTNGLWR
jgi:hypothetical protein